MRYDWLVDMVSRAQDYETARNSISLSFDVSPPALLRDIDDCEALLGVHLPPSYKDFLRTWNGFTFIRYDHTDDSCKVPNTAHVFGTEMLLTEAIAWKFARASRDRPRLCDDVVPVAGADRRRRLCPCFICRGAAWALR